MNLRAGTRAPGGGSGGSGAGSDAVSRGSGLPRLAVVAGVAVAAVGAGVIRRLVVGATRSAPPVPEKRPHDVVFGKQDGVEIGDVDNAMSPVAITDDYFWLRDDSRSSKEVLRHLAQENAFTNYRTLHLRRFSRALYREMLSHIQETDMSVPSPYGPYEYYARTKEGAGHVFHCRRKRATDGTHGPEEVMLDENALARGHKHCDVGAVEISPDHRILAYSVDYTGDEKYGIYFLDLTSRAHLDADLIEETNGAIEWGRDNSVVYYGTMDDAHRSFKAWMHRMRSINSSGSSEEDVCLFHESDELYSLSFAKSLSERFIYLVSSASTMSEVRYIDLHASPTDVHLVAERTDNVLYSVDHPGDDRFLITTNADGATNFKVVECEVTGDRSTWKDFLSYIPERTILGVVSFESFTVVAGREGGFSCLWILPEQDPRKMYKIPVDEDSSDIEVDTNLEFKTNILRYAYSSMKTPMQVFDYDVTTKDRRLRKETPVPNYDRDLYKTERLEAESRDGTKIPLSLVWNTRALRGREGQPLHCHLYGYGSYSSPVDPSFTANILPLLDRGIVYAIAHVRGGGEGGRSWYEAARFETKPKTFEDFIACAELLVSSGRTSPELLSIEGRSAGGLLMGSVINMRPDLFRAVIAGVPFVDVLNTMSDASIPLTTGEWLEWGNPHVQKYHDAIRGYCPYQNVDRKPYPAVLALAGLYDPRVLYSEPAKWVARLREHTTSDREILLKTDLDTGHFSASDRYRFLKERAFELSWLLNQVGAPREPTV